MVKVGPWVLGYQLSYGVRGYATRLQSVTYVCGHADAQQVPLCLVYESCASLRVCIAIRYVGFNVQDGRTVKDVCPQHVDCIRLCIYVVNPDTRHAQRVGPERTARGKDPHSLVAPQARRPHGEGNGRLPFPTVAGRRGRLPYYPDIVNILQSTYGFWRVIWLLKRNISRQVTDYACLAWYAKFLLERRMKGSYLYDGSHFAVRCALAVTSPYMGQCPIWSWPDALPCRAGR